MAVSDAQATKQSRTKCSTISFCVAQVSFPQVVPLSKHLTSPPAFTKKLLETLQPPFLHTHSNLPPSRRDGFSVQGLHEPITPAAMAMKHLTHASVLYIHNTSTTPTWRHDSFLPEWLRHLPPQPSSEAFLQTRCLEPSSGHCSGTCSGPCSATCSGTSSGTYSRNLLQSLLRSAPKSILWLKTPKASLLGKNTNGMHTVFLQFDVWMPFVDEDVTKMNDYTFYIVEV